MKPSLSQLMANYRAADYKVMPKNGRPFVLKVGQRSVEMEELYLASGARTAAYLTAWNPKGEMAPQAKNKLAQKKLKADLKGEGAVFEGIGQDPKALWPGEPSFLVLGITAAKARSLARKYRQVAYLWIGKDAVPQLKKS